MNYQKSFKEKGEREGFHQQGGRGKKYDHHGDRRNFIKRENEINEIFNGMKLEEK
jgi:hypothetical protein